MDSNTTNQGKEAEALALAFLNKHKLTLICKNFHSRFGEIDLVMDDGSCIIFIEVRYRKDTHILDPLETITANKQKRIILTSQSFLQKYDSQYPEHNYRFDVITIIGDMKDRKINWIQNAFSA